MTVSRMMSFYTSVSDQSRSPNSGFVHHA